MPERLKLFVVATAVIAATPGPNMLFVMTSSMRAGFRRSFAAMAGCLSGVVAMLLVSAAGLDVVLRAEPRLFWALRLAGAAYLLYLAAQLWISPPSDAPEGPRLSGSLYRQGLLIAFSNPKAILFAAAFLPQFVDPARERAPQFAVLIALFAVIEVSCYFAYAAAGRQAASFLARADRRRLLDRCAGALFAAFALMMIW